VVKFGNFESKKCYFLEISLGLSDIFIDQFGGIVDFLFVEFDRNMGNTVIICQFAGSDIFN